MPVFDTIRINQDHLGKVLVARRNTEPTDVELSIVSCVKNFTKWQRYISKEIKKSNSICITIEYVLN